VALKQIYANYSQSCTRDCGDLGRAGTDPNRPARPDTYELPGQRLDRLDGASLLRGSDVYALFLGCALWRAERARLAGEQWAAELLKS